MQVRGDFSKFLSSLKKKIGFLALAIRKSAVNAHQPILTTVRPVTCPLT